MIYGGIGPPGGGGLPYKKDRVAGRKFWKEPLRGIKLLFCGRGNWTTRSPVTNQSYNKICWPIPWIETYSWSLSFWPRYRRKGTHSSATVRTRHALLTVTHELCTLHAWRLLCPTSLGQNQSCLEPVTIKKLVLINAVISTLLWATSSFNLP